jgi:hypothetical protein
MLIKTGIPQSSADCGIPVFYSLQTRRRPFWFWSADKMHTPCGQNEAKLKSIGQN